MNVPPKPVRKSASMHTDAYARPQPGANKAAYNRKPASSAQGKADYVRKPAGVTPQGQPTGDKDSGNNAYRKQGVNRVSPPMRKGVD